MSRRLAECRECREPIRFVSLGAGRKIPVNPKPDPSGTVATRTIGGDLIGRVIGARSRPPMPREVLYRVHFATCEANPTREKPTARAPAADAPLF